MFAESFPHNVQARLRVIAPPTFSLNSTKIKTDCDRNESIWSFGEWTDRNLHNFNQRIIARAIIDIRDVLWWDPALNWKWGLQVCRNDAQSWNSKWQIVFRTTSKKTKTNDDEWSLLGETPNSQSQIPYSDMHFINEWGCMGQRKKQFMQQTYKSIIRGPTE